MHNLHDKKRAKGRLKLKNIGFRRPFCIFFKRV
nr:MAG TPA: hypothetical protein [Caudoviricetes sp.]